MTSARSEVEALVSGWLRSEGAAHKSKDLVERYIIRIDTELMDRLREEMVYNVVYDVVQSTRMRESNHILRKRSAFAKSVDSGTVPTVSPFDAFIQTADGMKRLGDMTVADIEFAIAKNAEAKRHYGAKEDFFSSIKTRMGTNGVVRDFVTEEELQKIIDATLEVDEEVSV